MSLTPSQQAKKAEVIAAGGKWVSPSKYLKKASSSSSAKAVKVRAPKAQIPASPMKSNRSQASKFESDYDSVNPACRMMIDQIIDPESQMVNVRLPTYGVSAVYTGHNISQCKYDVNGRSSVVVAPNLRNAIFATAGATWDQTLTSVGSADNPYMQQQLSVLPSDGEVDIVAPLYFNSRNALSTFPNSNTGKQLYALRTLGAGSATNQLILKLNEAFTPAIMVVRLYRYDSTFSLISTASAPTTTAGTATITFIPAAAVNMRYFALTVECQGTVPYVGGCDVYLSDTAGVEQLQVANISQHYIVQDISGSDTIFDSSEEFIVSAQSLLLTYEGSDLQNGGQLAICRLPAGSWVGKNSGIICDNYYDYISNLSRNSYNGPTKTGGYTFYLGQDERSYFYRPINAITFDDKPYIVAEWTSTGAPTQPIRIQVTTICQFTTNNNIYDQQPSDYLGEDYCKLLHILSNINSSYDNPGHREALTKALKGVGSKVMRVLKSPKTWRVVGGLASMLAMLA